MTRDKTERRAAKARTSVAAGQLTLVGTGLGALALIAVSAQALWHPDRPRAGSAEAAAVASLGLSVRPGSQARPSETRSSDIGAVAPRVWLSSLDSPGAGPFATSDYTLDPVLPRQRGVVPPTVPTARSPEPAAPQIASLPPVTAPVASVPPVAAVPASLTEPRITALEGTPRAVPPRRPAPVIAAAPAADPAEAPADTAEAPAPQTADPQALAALHAPTRSPLPRPRPAQAEAPAVEEAPSLLASIGAATGLIRSRTPQPRPEAVTRLASLDLGRTDAAPVAPTPAPAAIEIPALSRAATRGSCDDSLTRAIPRRARGAGDGSAVIGRLTGAGGRERDDAIAAEVLAGNLPDFLRTLVPVTFSGDGMTITICVTPDYLAVGSDRDFVRVPLGLPAAMRIAERFDMVLPTTRMVDAIYQQATVRLSPSPMDPTSAMSSTNYFLRHNTTVQGQMRQSGARLGQLVSGHKKDLVLTNRLASNPGRVAIYGWHQRNGRAIQPLSTVHGAQYADYSHGIRLVSRRAYVNGRAVDLRDLLSDSRTAGLVSSEGTISNRQLLALAD